MAELDSIRSILYSKSIDSTSLKPYTGLHFNTTGRILSNSIETDFAAIQVMSFYQHHRWIPIVWIMIHCIDMKDSYLLVDRMMLIIEFFRIILLNIVDINLFEWNNQVHVMSLEYSKNDVGKFFSFIRNNFLSSWSCCITSFWSIENTSYSYFTWLSCTCRTISQSRWNNGLTTFQQIKSIRNWTWK